MLFKKTIQLDFIAIPGMKNKKLKWCTNNINYKGTVVCSSYIGHKSSYLNRSIKH